MSHQSEIEALYKHILTLERRLRDVSAIITGGSAGITQLTGDATAGPGTGSQALTLVNTAVTPGTYGDASNVGQFTVDAKGRITAASEVAISGSGAAPWELIDTITLSGAAAHPVTGLAGYSSISVVFKDVTFGTSSGTQVRVSTDNGSTYLSTSGDYITINGGGGQANDTRLLPYTGAHTSSVRGGVLDIEGWNLTSPKWSRAVFFSVDAIYLRLIPVASALNALEISSSLGPDFNGGTAWVLGRAA